MKLITFGYFDGSSQYLTHTVSEGDSRVTAISEDIFHTSKGFLCIVKAANIPFLSVTYFDSMGKPLVILGYMPLEAGNLFTRDISFFMRCVCVLNTLRVNYQESGVGVSTMVDTDLANDIFLKPAQAN